MELNPHDLVRIRGVEELVTEHPPPQWVRASLLLAPFVVIRRAQNQNGCLPVGVRGWERGQRFAAWLPADRIIKVVTPYLLANPGTWKDVYNKFPPLTIRSLQLVTPLLDRTMYSWGPIGSAGFELATGISALRDSSDLDLLIDLNEALSMNAAGILMESLEKTTLVPLDIQINTPLGGVALKEYIKSNEVLIKTRNGPMLIPVESLWP